MERVDVYGAVGPVVRGLERVAVQLNLSLAPTAVVHARLVFHLSANFVLRFLCVRRPRQSHPTFIETTTVNERINLNQHVMAAAAIRPHFHERMAWHARTPKSASIMWYRGTPPG